MLLMRSGHITVRIRSVGMTVASIIGVWVVCVLLLRILELISAWLLVLSTIDHVHFIIVSIFTHSVYIWPEPFAKPTDLLENFFAASHLFVIDGSNVCIIVAVFHRHC